MPIGPCESLGRGCVNVVSSLAAVGRRGFRPPLWIADVTTSSRVYGEELFTRALTSPSNFPVTNSWTGDLLGRSDGGVHGAAEFAGCRHAVGRRPSYKHGCHSAVSRAHFDVGIGVDRCGGELFGPGSFSVVGDVGSCTGGRGFAVVVIVGRGLDDGVGRRCDHDCGIRRFVQQHHVGVVAIFLGLFGVVDVDDCASRGSIARDDCAVDNDDCASCGDVASGDACADRSTDYACADRSTGDVGPDYSSAHDRVVSAGGAWDR